MLTLDALLQNLNLNFVINKSKSLEAYLNKQSYQASKTIVIRNYADIDQLSHGVLFSKRVLKPQELIFWERSAHWEISTGEYLFTEKLCNGDIGL